MIAGVVPDQLIAEHGLSPQDAYMLCSLAGDLKILELVDAGMWNVGMTLPLSIFSGEGASGGARPSSSLTRTTGRSSSMAR